MSFIKAAIGSSESTDVQPKKFVTPNAKTDQPESAGKYELKLNNGRTYILAQSQVDWLKKRYQSTAADAYQMDAEDQIRKFTGKLPLSFEKSYKGTTLDQNLYQQGLPSEKYIEQYIGAYLNWYGDGTSYKFDDKAKGSISNKFKSDWEYEYTIEDQKRKAAGQMPLAIEKKYGDNRRDYELMQQGLPPESMLTDYVNAFETVEYETAKKEQLYNTATIKIMEAEAALGGYKQLSDEERIKIFDEVYADAQYDDIRQLWQKSPVEDKSDGVIDSLAELDSKWSKAGKKEATSGEPTISWTDFIGGYEKRKSGVLVDQAAYDTAIAEIKKQTTASLTNKDEVRRYVESRSADRPAEIFADMYGAGLSIGRVREAKDYLWGKATTKEEKDAIKSAFGQAIDAYNADSAEAVFGFVSDIFSEEKRAERKAAREGKRSGDAAVKDGVVKQFNQGATSTIDADDAEKIFKSHLVYDENGKPTKESIALATNMMYEAGATTPIVLEVGKRAGMKSGIFSQDYADKQKETLQDSMMGAYEAQVSGTEPVAEQKSPNDLTAFNSAFSDVVAERDLAQRKEHIDASYKANVESGNMTSSDFYNAVRRAGWGDAIDVAKGAESYYKEVYAPKFEKNGEQLPKWEEIDQAAFIANFESGKDLNPDIHKTGEEIVRGSLSRVFTSGIFEVIGGAVSFADMATAKISGRTDTWDFTKRTSEAIAASQGVSSNQSFGSQAASLSSTVASELIRMYTVSQIGSGVLSMFSKGASAIAGAVSQTNAGNLLSQIAANATPAMTKGASALVKGTKWLISSSPFIATSMGSYYTEAVQSGANVDQAVLYGTVCGAMEGALEAVGTELWLGRMFGGQSVAKGIISAGKAAFKSGAILPKALMIRLVSSTLGNALEEGASYAISIGMQKATYNKDAQFDWTEAGNQALMGGLIGLLGAGINARADTQSNILAEFMNSKAGQEWLADDKNNSAFTDMFVMSTIADTVPDQARSAMRMQENAKSVSDVSAMVRDIDQHSRQMDAGQKQYDIDIAKIDSELRKKQDAVSNLATRLEQLATDKSPFGMKKWAKLAEQLRVAQSELDVEQAQADAKRTERTAAFTETQEQHKIAIAKAQESLKGVAVSITEAFDPQISQIRDLVRDKVVAVPNEIAQEILTKMDAAHAGKLFDYIQTKNDLYQRQYESVTGLPQTPTSPVQPATDAQTVQAPTVQPTAENASIVSTEPRVTNAADALFEYKAELEAMAIENQTSIEDRLSFSGEELPYVRVGLKVSKSASDKAIGTVKDHFKSWRGMAIHEQFQREVDGVVLQVLSDNPKYTENPDAIVSRLTNAFKHVSIDYNPTDMGYKGYDGREIESIRTLMRSQSFALGYYKNDGTLKRDFNEETRKSAFGSIMLKKKATKRGEVLSNIDTFYAEELTPRYPDLFPEEISTPQDQLDKMVEFMKATKRQEGVSIYNVDGGVTAYEIASHTADGLINDLIGAYNELRTQRGTKSNDNTGKAAETARVIAQADSSTQTSQPETVAEKSEATPANSAETMGLDGISVGAMTSKKGLSDGKTAISQFYSNTLETMDTDQHTQDVRDALQAFDEAYSYDVVSEKESIAKAKERLARGVTPDVIEELRMKNTWTGVDVDVAMAVKESYRQAGIETGDMNDYINWTLLIADRVGEGGRAIQALAKYTRDIKEKSIVLMQKNVNKSDKAATPKQKSKVSKQTDKIAKVVDEALKVNATPDSVESEVTKVAKKQTAKSVKDAFIRLQNKQIDRAAFDENVKKAVNQENGLSGFTTEDAKRVIELLDTAEQQTDSYERRRYQSMAAQIIANTEPVTFGEKFRSVQRIMMLLNPRTMIRNVAANVVFAPFEWAKDLPATLVDMVVAKKTGERTTTVSLQKQAAAFGGLKRGVSEVGKDIKYGVNTSKSTGKYEMTAKDVWRGKFMNFLDDMVGYGLNAGDRPFYEAAYDEFAMNEKLLGHDLESDEVQQRIMNLSLDRVFQGNPAIFEGMKRIRNGIDQFAPPFGTLLIPFTQTPANLADKILDYSVGIVRAGKQLYDASKTGGKFDQKMFVDRIGRAITGNGLMILGYALAKAGIINMAGDDDKERQAMKNAGVTAYSVQLGDASIAINWAEPVGSIMLMGATLAQQGANGESLNVIEGGKMMFNSFFDNSIFSNLTALFGSGYGDTASGIENFALGTTTQFMPSTLAAIARTFDPYERDTYDPNKLLAQGKRLLSYFPGLRNALPFKYGSDGKPVESNYGGEFFGRVLNTMVNPALVDRKSGDAVNDEIYRLYQGGYTDQLLPVAAKTIANTTLTASQRRELQQMLGEATYNAAQRIIESGAYQSLTDDEKVAALADAVDDAARDARDAFKNKLGK